MKIIPQKLIPNFSLPLPIFTSIHIADAIGKDGEEFGVFLGLDKKQVAELKKLSLDDNDIELQKNTGDRERFGEEGSYEKWYKKNRTPFCLVHKKSDAMSALVWFGPLPFLDVNDNWHAVGWRSYHPFRGKGIMKNFTQFAMDFYAKHVPEAKFWVKIAKENAGSIRLGDSLGFQILDEASDDFSTVMIR